MKNLILLSTFVIPSISFAYTYTLDELYALALKNSKSINLSKQDLEIFKYNKLSSLTNMGPKFSTSAKYIRWNEPTDISFGFQLPPQFQNLGIKIPDKMHVMDQDTKDISLTITQPMTQLYSMYQIYKINKLNEDISYLDLSTQVSNIKYKIAEAYFNLLKLQKTKESLIQSIKLIEAYKEKTEQLYKNGMVQKDDIMKVDVKLSQVKDSLNEINSTIDIIKSSINILIGKDANEELEVKDTYSEEPKSFDYTLDECIEKALANRDDLKALKLRIEMLEAKRQATIGTMIPSVAGIFTYSRQWGNAFQKDESWFVGVSLSWTFWEWGTTYFQLKSNDYEIRKTRFGFDAMSDGIILDVKGAYFKAKNSFDAINSNKKSVELSEEVYRISLKKYENAQITATEVLDAETMLTTSKINYINSLYTYYLNLEYLKKIINKKEDL
ncbi:MAG: TolC family protein [Deltaproteobacteria bacterium]|nr:TolC family protein [Deltaproteobacteria bacterium]